MNNNFLNNLWRWKCGLPEIDNIETFDINKLIETEWNNEFEILMRNRLIIGAFRYGKINIKNTLNKHKYNRIQAIQSRLNKYSDTGNKEHLVDIANFCLLEYTECNHPNSHFEAIDDGEHCLLECIMRERLDKQELLIDKPEKL